MTTREELLRPKTKRRPGRRRHRRSSNTRSPRGVALIMVLTAIAIFTAVVVDFSYSSRVELDLAANARDEVRSYFLARSAVNFSRLILHFQKQLDTSPLMSMAGGGGGMDMSKFLSANGLGGTTAGAAGAAGLGGGLGGLPTSAMPGSGGLVIRLWELLPIDSGMLQMFLGGAGSSSDDFTKTGELKPLDVKSDAPQFGGAPRALPSLGAPGAPGALGAIPGAKGKMKSFGDFSGSFHAEIEDESNKYNVAWLDNLARVMQIAITRGLMMFGDKRYEWLYDEEDAHGLRTTSRDILINIHDYIDADQVASALNPQDPVNPFTPGFSDETQPYSRYKPSYKPKNAPLDSIDELYMVDGVSDKFMAAFRDRITVFPDKNKAINVNTDDPFMQLVNIYMAAANPADPNLQNPLVIQQVLRDLSMAKMFSGLGITVPQFIGILQADKIAVDPQMMSNLQGQTRFTDKSDTFTIHAMGEAGKVQKKLTVVVRTDNGLGQLMYWKEE
jgi:general secretion pathway protein K